MSFNFSCPVCGCRLEKDGGSLRCASGHCFDLAKQGYVNLLQSQKSSEKRHGDDKLMVRSRADFLNCGYYDELVELIIKRLHEIAVSGMKILDLGCGECYYTSKVASTLPDAVIGGIDISKQALITGGKRCKSVSLAVASIFKLPVSDEYCDLVMNIFAPHSVDEISRVLKKSGIWLRVYPLECHLMGLKSVIYDTPYLNDVDRSVPNGFSAVSRDEIKSRITVGGNDNILNLFRMTPYYYKTGKTDQDKLRNVDSLETEIEFGVDLLRKN